MWKTILSIFLAVQLSAEVVNLDKFDEGLNTRLAPILLPNGGTPDCQNVLFDEVGGITRRNGYRYKGYADVDTVGQRLFPYKRSSGAKYLYKQINASLYKTISGDDDSWTSVRSDIRYQQNFLDSAIIENLLFLANGIDNVFSVDGGSSYEEYDFIKKGKYITSMSEGTSGVLYDRGFVANTYDFASGVYWSDVAYSITDSNAWSESQIFLVGGNDGEVITALYVWRGDLYIFKERSVWRLTGNDPSNWVLRRLTREYGCFGQDTIQEKDNILIFVSKDRKAVVGFDGSFFKELSKPIEPDLENWDNFEGYYNYWIQSTSDDFIAGKSTGNEVGADIVLEDYTKVWKSSDTYPFAFSTNTVLFSTSAFSNTNIEGEDITLKSTTSYTGTVNYPTLIDVSKTSAYKQGSGLEWEYTDPDWTTMIDGKWKIYDLGSISERFGTMASVTNPAINRFVSEKIYTSILKVSSGRLWYDFDIDFSTDRYKKVRYKFNFSNIVDMILTTAQNDAFDVSNKISYTLEVNIYYHTATENNILAGSKYYSYSFDGNQFEWYGEMPYGSPVLASPLFPDAGGVSPLRLNATLVSIPHGIDDEFEFTQPTNGAKTFRFEIGIKEENIKYEGDALVQRIYLDVKDIYQIEFYKGGSDELYSSAGMYTTEIHSFDEQVYLSTFTATVDSRLSEGTTVQFLIRSSSASTMSGSTWTAIQDGIQIPTGLSPCNYVQVIASFTTTQSSHTATLQSISVGATKSTSSFQTANFQVDEITGWKYFISDDTTPNDTGISYAIRTSSSEAGLSSATWDWIESGDLLDSGRHTSTHTWIVAKATSSTTDGTRRPEIHSLTFTWYPESEPIRLTSKIVDKRYWLGVSTYTGYNDNIYVLDKNMKWTRFSGYTPADIANWKGLTYILDASSSAIWEADYGNADRWESATASCTIVSYWTSKALFLALDRESSIEYIYSSLKATGGDLTVGYAMYGDSYSEFDIDLSGSGEVNDRARITTGETWKVWSFKFSDTSTVDPWEIHNVGVYFVPKPLR